MRSTNADTIIQHATIYTPTQVIANGVVHFNSNSIVAIGHHDEMHTYSNSHQTVIDATDAIITPGFIEVHTHGGGGFALHTTNPAEIHSYAHWTTSTGVTSFLIATVGTPATLPTAQLQTAVAATEQYRATSTSSTGAEPL